MGVLQAFHGRGVHNEGITLAEPVNISSDEESTPVGEKGPEVTVLEPAGYSEKGALAISSNEPSGVARIEAVQQVWGQRGKYYLWAGLAMMMFIFEVSLTSRQEITVAIRLRTL